MSKVHVICALLPLLFVVPGSQGDNQLEDLCRTLAKRLGEDIHDDVQRLDRLGLGWIVGGGV